MNIYIEKPVDSTSGHSNSCWVPVCSNLELTGDSVNVIFAGYKDAATKTGGGTPGENRVCSISLSEIPAWTDFIAQVMDWVVANDSALKDGELKEF